MTAADIHAIQITLPVTIYLTDSVSTYYRLFWSIG